MNYFDNTTPIRPGAVVSCRFPQAETPHLPGPNARPALVVKVLFDTRDQTWKAVVAYGTSRFNGSNAGLEITVDDATDLRPSGLNRPTRFTLSRMRILPLDKAFFAFRGGECPILGFIPDAKVRRMQMLCLHLAKKSEEIGRALKPDNAMVTSKDALSTFGRHRPKKGIENADAVDSVMLAKLTGRVNDLTAEGSRMTRADKKPARNAVPTGRATVVTGCNRSKPTLSIQIR